MGKNIGIQHFLKYFSSDKTY